MARRGVTTRIATTKDTAALARIFTDAYGPTSTTDVRRMMRSFPKDEVWLAVADGVAASTATVRYMNFVVGGKPFKTAGILMVGTLWDYRRRGLATRLMKDIEKRAKAKGISNLTLFTGRQLPAIRIYRRLGYVDGVDWQRYMMMQRPATFLSAHFKRQTRYLMKVKFGKKVFDSFQYRALIDSPECRLTITCSEKGFKAVAGRRGRPDLVMKGNVVNIIECFWNRVKYDRYLQQGIIRVTGPQKARDLWRRIITQEWVE